MLTKLNIIEQRTAIEAGYVNNSDDLGKATNHGITEATAIKHKYLWLEYGFKGDMKDLPVELAYKIYEESWWDKLWLDDVMRFSPELCERLFDFGINAGRKNAVKSLQRVLNIHNVKGTRYPDLKVDGYMGNATLNAIEAYLKMPYPEQAMKLTALMYCMQQYHYVSISESRERNETFTNGWTARVWNDIKQTFSRYSK